MKRVRILALLLCVLTFAAPSALAANYTFPYAGVRLESQDGWTLLTPETLEGQTEMIAELGGDIDALYADYAVNHVVFEVYMPDGVQVSLTVVETEQTAAWGSAAEMTEVEKAALLDGYAGLGYRNVRWSEGLSGYLRYDWALEAGGAVVTFSRLTTVQGGRFYTFTAASAQMSADALHEANLEVLANLSYFGGTDGVAVVGENLSALPSPIEDDGAVTPIALVDFSGVSLEDTTTLAIQTLPGAELLLQTATDTLRGRANGEGLHTFTLSTKRQVDYSYTLTASAEGRETSEMQITIQRRLSGAQQKAAYRASASTLETIGYQNLVSNPSAYSGTALTFRGMVADTIDVGGFPCVLMYTTNPGKGVWKRPLWVLFTAGEDIEVGGIYTVYGDIRGDAIAYTDETGETEDLPVILYRELIR